jgi:hypothetical protein
MKIHREHGVDGKTCEKLEEEEEETRTPPYKKTKKNCMTINHQLPI